MKVLPFSLALLAALALPFAGTNTMAAGREEPSLSAPAISPAAPALFQRIVVFGASVSAGFDSSQPFGGPKTAECRFANFLEAAINAAHEPIVTRANTFLFMKPIEGMEKIVSAVTEGQPSLAIGLDALFWFCYGTVATNEERLARFEAGLRFLERIEAPLIVGDIPDASRAVGKILSKDEMPELAIIAKCNQRLHTWAAARRNVTIFPLALLMSAAGGDEPFSLVGKTWEKGKSRALLQQDLLHPSRHGLAALAVAVLQAAAGGEGSALAKEAINFDLEGVYTTGISRAKAEPVKEAKAEKP